MNEKRLSEINERKSAILTEIDSADEARMAALETELDGLEKEETELRKKLNLRSRIGDSVTKPVATESGDDKEERARKFIETRATTISSGKIAIPSSTQNEVNPTLDSGNGILNLVHIEDYIGMGTNIVPYEKPGMEAGVDAEGASTESDFVTDYVEIKPVTVDVYTEVSRETRKLSPVRYMQAVEQAALKALKKKIGKLIISSDKQDNPIFYGINKAPTCVQTVEINAIDASTLRKIMLSFGGDEDVEGAAILILTKDDLQAFGAVRGTNEKKPVYEITPDTANPNSGIIKDGGLSCRYTLNSALKPFEKAEAGADVMYYGKPMAYEVDIFSDYQITVSEEAALKKRMIAVLGEVMVGGNVTVYNGFIKIQKSQS